MNILEFVFGGHVHFFLLVVYLRSPRLAYVQL